MKSFGYYDPWSNLVTRSGLPGDQVVSALQKSIRRGNVENASTFAYEMYITSPEMENKLWQRLMVISVEDIGMGATNAPVIIKTLNEMRKEFDYDAVDRPLFFVHAIRYLCLQKKERTSDCLKNIIEKEFEANKEIVIPDYAIDMHTIKGQELGRDVFYFLDVASQVYPEMEVENDYKERLYKILREEA